jgi:protein SCO1/2
MSRSATLLTTLLAAAALVTGLWVSVGVLGPRPPQPLPAELTATVLPAPRPLAAFSLVDQHGQRFDLQRLKGKWSLLFFGYTHCPDVCPTTMTVLRQVYDRLAATPEVLAQAQVVFVSVDPQRDSPEQLGAYVGYFNQNFIGVTGDEADLQCLTRQLGILHMRAPGSTPENYLVDHTASILLIDPRARLHAVFSTPHDAANIADDFLAIYKLTGHGDSRRPGTRTSARLDRCPHPSLSRLRARWSAYG